ncbi:MULTISPECIES: type II toxin-antitoxin system RelB/DinJ family antitoxin [unclassified Mesorhizobium]|uniref:type II toxin-antitoxin system RelB/DinJ family antitoxin n=1 Tax=unclassified Mesorhizobium TaxID=325217 RepID=UPI00301561C5
MAATGMVHVRVDEDEKNEASAVLASMGLSVSGVVRVMLKRIAREKTVPFDLRMPNAETRAAMAEADTIIQNGRARFATAQELLDDLEKAGER